MLFIDERDVLRRDANMKRGKIDQILGKNKRFCIPMAALGEAVHMVRKKHPGKDKYGPILEELNRLLDSGYLEVRFISDPEATFSLAREISTMYQDPRDRISPMDALIVASAATDQDCVSFYTADSQLISNSNLTGLIYQSRSDAGYNQMKIGSVSNLR